MFAPRVMLRGQPPTSMCGTHKVVEDDRYTRAQRWKALLLAYILPFVLLAGVIVLADWLTDNEYIIGGAALATVAVYYLVLFAVKPKV